MVEIEASSYFRHLRNASWHVFRPAAIRLTSLILHPLTESLELNIDALFQQEQLALPENKTGYCKAKVVLHSCLQKLFLAKNDGHVALLLLYIMMDQG